MFPPRREVLALFGGVGTSWGRQELRPLEISLVSCSLTDFYSKKVVCLVSSAG